MHYVLTILSELKGTLKMYAVDLDLSFQLQKYQYNNKI